MPRIPTAVLSLAAGLTLLASACTGPSNRMAEDAPEPSTSRLVGTAATTTPASELRSELSYLLEEHVQLVGLATRTAIVSKPGAAEVAAVVATHDVNALALSKVIGRSYPTLESPLLASWRQHLSFFLDYARAKAAGSGRAVAQARSDLDGFRTSFGLLINSVVPTLPADAVTAELKPHVDALLETIDAQVGGDRRQFALLRTAAGHMQSTAALLAGGIASDLKLSKTETPAADLRSGLTALLTQHVYSLAMAVDTALAKGGNLQDPLVTGSLDALDGTTIALSKALGSAYPAVQKPFAQSWRQHVGFVLDYALAKADGSLPRAAASRKDIDGYRADFGQLINSVVVDLPASAVAAELTPFVTDLLVAIDADVEGRADAVSKLRAAATRMPKTAGTLAGAIAEDKKLA